MMSKPIVLVSSCSETPSLNIIKEILGDQEIVLPECLLEDVQAYPWDVSTKYYTAQVALCTAPSRTIGDKAFAERVEAFVVHFDSTKVNSFNSMKLWVPFIKELDPEIKLLLCDTCRPDDEVSRLMAWEWCLENSFEFIEMYPEESEQQGSDLEDDFPESVGVERIVQALHSHTWSNLVMKEKSNVRSAYMTEIMNEDVDDVSCSDDAENTTASYQLSTASQDTQNTNCSATKNSKQCENCDSAESNVLPSSCRTAAPAVIGAEASSPQQTQAVTDSMIPGNNVDTEEESFEKLFENFRLMKEKADSLPFEERKQYAEQVSQVKSVAVQFWKAIGGDDDEIDGLDSD